MLEPLELSVVMPVHNEGLNIEKTLQALKTNVPVPHEVVIVYDREEDETLPAVRPLLPSYDRLRLVRNTVAPGPSGALRTGFQHARGARVLVAMADLCDDFTQIGHLLSLVPREADIASPSRYCKGGIQTAQAVAQSLGSEVCRSPYEVADGHSDV